MKKFFKYTILLFLLVAIIVSAGTGIYLYRLNSELPAVKDLKDFNYKQPTIIYDINLKEIAELGDERRYPLKSEEIPEKLKQAVVAVEDSRFYKHGGVDLMGIMRAFIVNVKAGRVVEGGSTLTQQLVKIIYLTPERKLKRKVKEAILAYKLDNNMSKDEILTLYLNLVYFGRGAYGVEAAAQNYFGKHVNELNLSEIAMIAGLPKAPGLYAPHLNPDRAKKRMTHVLFRMFEEGYITEAQYNEAKDVEIEIIKDVKPKLQNAAYFVDYVIKEMAKSFPDMDIKNAGLKIYTTLDLNLQTVAETAVKENLIRVSKRQGYFGPIGNAESDKLEKLKSKYSYVKDLGFKIAKVTNVERTKLKADLNGQEIILKIKKNNWAKPYESNLWRLDDFRKILKTSDFIFVKNYGKNDYRLEQIPEVEGALLSVNPKDGSIFAMVGGFDFNKSMFNRVVQSKRQVGSLFKPIVYSTAIENGYSAMSTIYDSPIILDTGEEGEYWKPQNFEKSFYGYTTLKHALTKSRNVVTIKLAQKLGVRKIIKQAKKFGITSEFQKDLSISIGSTAISLMEMVRAYTAFTNLGEYQPLRAIIKVVASSGEVLKEFEIPERVEALSPETAEIMSNMLINVVENGTGRKALKIKRVIGGKTGTTNDYKDAWFMGIMPNIITGVWVGFDDFKTIGRLETGSRAALPAWLGYTERIIDKFDYALFPVSGKVTYYKVDNETFKISEAFNKNFKFEPFADDNVNNILTIDK